MTKKCNPNVMVSIEQGEHNLYSNEESREHTAMYRLIKTQQSYAVLSASYPVGPKIPDILALAPTNGDKLSAELIK